MSALSCMATYRSKGIRIFAIDPESFLLVSSTRTFASFERTLVDVGKLGLLLTVSFHQSTVPTLVLVWNTCCPLGVVITPDPLLLGLLLWTELPFRSVPEVVVKLARS